MYRTPLWKRWRNNLVCWRGRIKNQWRNVRTAVAFLRGRPDDDQAYALMRAGWNRLGSWPVVSIDAESILERLRDTYVDHPEFPRLAADAAERVYTKWDGDSSDFTSGVIDWGVQIAEEYAESDGVPLVEAA